MSSDQLRDVLREETEAACHEALQTHGQISDDRLKTLEHLDRLMKISATLKPPKTHKRWPVAVMLGVCLLIISLLLFVRCQRTEIELDLKLTDLRFVLSDQALLVDKMQFTALGLSGLKEIQLPRAQRQATNRFQVSVVEKHDPEDKKPPAPAGIISLTDLLLPAGTLVELNYLESPNRYRLSLEIPAGEKLDLKISVKGTLNIALPEAAEQVEYSSPRPIRMQLASQYVILDFSLPEGTRAAFSFLPAQAFKFSRIEEYLDTDETHIRRVPTVLSGALYFAALNGRKYSLREGEDVRFKTSEGRIRSLKLEKNQLALKFHGDVTGMTTGWETTRVKLMPTWLAWLQARQGPGLLWGTSLFLFGIVNQAIRWWKKGK